MRSFVSLVTCLVLAGVARAQEAPSYPPLPEAFSSFGAAVADGHVYVYGGHTGKTHTYSTAGVTGKFRRLNLAAPKAWEELPAGAAMQGLALVAHGGKIYRVGGMSPRNPPGEPSDNHSTASAEVFDPQLGKWAPLPELPGGGRSSHDAAVVGDLLVVVGGWQLNGAGGKSHWHATTLILDLAQKAPRWETVKQPFQRRALNVAAFDGKVYVVGGMGPENDTEKTVDVFDPQTRTWGRGPALPGGIRNAFTPAATTAGGRLYVSPPDGKVYRLGAKKDAWEEITALEKPRMVHRIVPARADLLLVLGGGGRGGNVAQVEAIALSALVPAKSTSRVASPTEQTFCPIMTSVPIEADSKEVEYRGVKVKVCCVTCLKKWHADPEAYLNVALLPQLRNMDLPKRAIAQVYCPVYPDRVVSAKGPSAEYQGRTLYFFNETAKNRFLENPTQYVKAAQAGGR